MRHQTKLAPRVILGLACGLVAATSAAQVSVNVNIGQPGYYGPLPMIAGYTPQLWYPNPVLAIGQMVAGLAPIYLNVPDAHRLQWPRYCSLYDACQVPVYFVRDSWYRQHYAPRYRQLHGGPAPRKAEPARQPQKSAAQPKAGGQQPAPHSGGSQPGRSAQPAQGPGGGKSPGGARH